MTLADARVGLTLRIEAFDRPDQEAEAIRLGLMVGHEVTVRHKISRGPLVVQSGVSEIAVGYHLARRIQVIPLS